MSHNRSRGYFIFQITQYYYEIVATKLLLCSSDNFEVICFVWLLCESLAYLSCHCLKPNDGLKKVVGGGRFSSFIIDSRLIYLGVDFSKQYEIGSQATLQKTFI